MQVVLTSRPGFGSWMSNLMKVKRVEFEGDSTMTMLVSCQGKLSYGSGVGG